MDKDEEKQLVDDLVKEVYEEVQEEMSEKKEPDIQKVYIKNYGNLLLEIIGQNDIGLSTKSTRNDERLFIPWTSIIMVSKMKKRDENERKK